jgi:predicted regulator of amino acid metabolism with ACT domain
MPVITNEILIKAPIKKCFDLARNVDVHTRTVSKTKERVIETPEKRELMKMLNQLENMK